MLLSTTMGMTEHCTIIILRQSFRPYILAEEKNKTTYIITRTSLSPLQNINDKLKAHMSKHHRLEDSNTDSVLLKILPVRKLRVFNNTGRSLNPVFANTMRLQCSPFSLLLACFPSLLRPQDYCQKKL